MRSDEHEDESAETKGEDYEAAMLDFLQKEISAPTGSAAQKGAPDDVDLLVDNFLKEAITVTESQEPPVERETEDLDLLFSRIFMSQNEPVPDASRSADPDDLQPVSQASSLDDSGNAGLRANAEPPVRAAAMEKSAPETVPAVLEPGAPEAPIAAAPREILPDRKPSVAGMEPVPPQERSNVFTFATNKKAASGRLVLILGSAFVCLLLGVGIVYFTGTKNGPANTADSTPPPREPAASANIDEGNVQPESPNRGAAAKSVPARTSRPAAPAATPANSTAAVNSGSVAKPDAPSKAPAPAVPEPPVAPGVTNPAAGNAGIVPAADKPAPPPENTLGNQLLRAAENPTSLAAVQSRPPGAGSLAPLTPRATPNLAGLANFNRAAEPAAPAPRTITPVEVISKVVPVYPEIAKRTRTAGTVVLEVQVDETGKAVKATPESGPMMLRTEAVNAVMRWKFKPASLNGINVAGSLKVSLVFQGPR